MNKIKVTPEGREGIWIPEKESLKAWIKSKKLKHIHNFIPNRGVFIGADHDVKSVLEDIDNGERIAIFTGDTAKSQMNHTLAIITNNTLEIYDIGTVKEEDLEITNE